MRLSAHVHPMTPQVEQALIASPCDVPATPASGAPQGAGDMTL
jgi:hypothetical protein